MERLHADVVVVGGGPAGISASVAAARLGAKTLLIERYGFLGGWAAVGLVSPMMTFLGPNGPVVGGVGEELIQRLCGSGGSMGHIPDPIGFAPSITPFDHEMMKIEAEQMLLEAGVNLSYHSLVTGTKQTKGTIQVVEGYGKSGPFCVECTSVVDCSGDGDLLKLSGAPFSVGDAKGNVQPASLIFRLTDIDLEQVHRYVAEHPEEFVLPYPPEANRVHCEYTAIAGFFSLVRSAADAGNFKVPRDRVLFFSDIYGKDITVNMTRLPSVALDEHADWTRAEIEGRKQALDVVDFLRKHIPGFSECRISQLASQVGLREARRATGDYELTLADVVEARCFEDRIALGAFPIDIHSSQTNGLVTRKVNAAYSIPYRSLLPKTSNNLWVAGRCISTSSEAHASARVIPTCFATGQAAGLAASLAVKKSCHSREIDIDELQSLLRTDGAILES